MVKTAAIFLRVEGETKQRIEEAARKRGQSLTTFMLSAASAEARRAEATPQPRGRHGGVPTYFRAACWEARQGGSHGYYHPAYILTRSLGAEQPGDLEIDEWVEEVDRLRDLLANRDEGGVWEWCRDHFPKMMELIPKRRKDSFLEGVRRAYEDEGIGV